MKRTAFVDVALTGEPTLADVIRRLRAWMGSTHTAPWPLHVRIVCVKAERTFSLYHDEWLYRLRVEVTST